MLPAFYAPAQMDLVSLTALLDNNGKKLESQLLKKGFYRSGNYTPEELFFKKYSYEDSVDVERSCRVVFKDDFCQLVYTTSSENEFNSWEKEIDKQMQAQATAQEKTLFIGSEGIILQSTQLEKDSSKVYVFKASRKILPKAKNLVFAEDLLSFDAHAFLETVFGKKNVIEDVFEFSDSLKNKCSVIYPNTSRQAIFIWKDEINLKDLVFVIIGEPTGKTQEGFQQVSLPEWRSRQGIRCGMTAAEVEMLNEEPVHFYRHSSSHSGILAQGNKGRIDFEKIEMVFECMNCDFVNVAWDGEVINTNMAVSNNQKWYVSSFAVVR